MMARKVIAGNWKMNGDPARVDAFARALLSQVAWGELQADLVICPPALLVSQLCTLSAGTPLQVGGQDCHWNVQGAHTGDLSAQLLAELGATHVIVGHSERRRDHGETPAQIGAKVAAALTAGLIAIFCVGETAQERKDGRTLTVVEAQVRASLSVACERTALDRLIVAYEPVWAIGAGKAANLSDIAHVHCALRQILTDEVGEVAIQTPLLYGGSVTADNAADILSVSNVDGALVGGASLVAEDFQAIAQALL